MPDFLNDPLGQYYLAALIMLWPMGRIFRRAGFHPGFAAVLAVPMIGYLICAGMLTFRKWPAAQKTGKA